MAEDKHILGSAYWVWKQACGDPQNGIGAFGNALMMQSCGYPGDVEFPPKSDLLEILSRAYPQVAPGQITSLNTEKAAFTITGTTEIASCDLKIWVPGESEAAVTSTGVDNLVSIQVPGGWYLTGCVTGDYELTSEG